MSQGFLGFVGMTKETAWGSGTTISSGDFIEAMSEDLSATLERFPHKVLIGSMAEPDDSLGLWRIQGGVRFAATPIALGQALRSVLHSYTQSTVASGFLHTHTFQTTSGGADFDAQVPNQPYTMLVFRDVTSSHRYPGFVGNELTLSFGPGAVMCDLRGIARSHGIVATPAATFPNSPNKPFTFDKVSLSVGGAGTSLIETMTVKISNSFTGYGALNLSQYIAKIRRSTQQMVEVNGTIDFADLTEYTNFVNQTEQRVTLSATKAASFQMIVDIPRVVYTAFPMGINDAGRQMVSFTGKAFYHAGSGLAIKVSVTSTRSSHA